MQRGGRTRRKALFYLHGFHRAARRNRPHAGRLAARLVNLEGRINLCRTRKQQAEPLRFESEEPLALTAYVTHQLRGMPVNVTVDMQNRRNFEHGRELYYRRKRPASGGSP